MAELSRILHVDDEPDIREVAKVALEAIGGFQGSCRLKIKITPPYLS